MSTRLKSIKTQVVPILKKYKVKRASLFGSVLREDFHPSKSDIDMLVEFSSKQSLFGYLRLKIELERKLKKPVDVVEYDTLKPRIKAQVLKAAVPIL